MQLLTSNNKLYTCIDKLHVEFRSLNGSTYMNKWPLLPMFKCWKLLLWATYPLVSCQQLRGVESWLPPQIWGLEIQGKQKEWVRVTKSSSFGFLICRKVCLQNIDRMVLVECNLFGFICFLVHAYNKGGGCFQYSQCR